MTRFGQKLGPRARTRYGNCSVCGHAAAILLDGTVGRHNTRRVDRNGEPYVTSEKCPGVGEPPLPMEEGEAQ